LRFATVKVAASTLQLDVIKARAAIATTTPTDITARLLVVLLVIIAPVPAV
jgi:hypothetical protein